MKTRHEIIDIWIAVDGAIFLDKYDCIDHEHGIYSDEIYSDEINNNDGDDNE